MRIGGVTDASQSLQPAAHPKYGAIIAPMGSLGFLVTGVTAAAIVACTSGTDASSQGSSNLTETPDAAVATDGGGADATPGDAADAAVDAGPAVPTYDDVAPIIAASCTSCHEHAAGDFATKDAVAQNGASMLAVIKRGKMPKGNPTFATTPDGQELVKYLTFSPDIQ